MSSETGRPDTTPSALPVLAADASLSDAGTMQLLLAAILAIAAVVV